MSLDVTLTEEPCPHCGRRGCVVYDANITHNLGSMADAAGIYEAVWRPEECGITKASQLIPILEEGIRKMKEDPDKFRAYDSPNGWGLYVNFLPWLEAYLDACKKCPKANVSVSR